MSRARGAARHSCNAAFVCAVRCIGISAIWSQSDPLDSNIHWLVVTWRIYRYDVAADSWQYITDAPTWGAEGWIEATPGFLHVGGGYGTNRWSTYNIATDTWTGNGTLPFSRQGAATAGPGNEIYGYRSGTLWNLSQGNQVVATGGLGVGNYTYERFIWDEQHGIFLVTDNYNNGRGWEVWAIRP